MANHPNEEQYIPGRKQGRPVIMNTETTTKTAHLNVINQISDRALELIWNRIDAKDANTERWGANAYDLDITAAELSDILHPVGGTFAALDKKALEDDVMDAILTSVDSATGHLKLEGEHLRIHLEKLWSVYEWQVALYHVAKSEPAFVEKYRSWKMRQIDMLGADWGERTAKQ